MSSSRHQGSNVAWTFRSALPRLNVAVISLLTTVFNVRQRIVSFEFLLSIPSNIDWRVATPREAKEGLRACQVISAASKHPKINKIHFNSVSFFDNHGYPESAEAFPLDETGSVDILLSLIDCTGTRRFRANNFRLVEIISDRQKFIGLRDETSFL